MRNIIMDVDGTITPSRGKMDPDFKAWLSDFSTHNAIYLVTGSDRAKTLEQVGSFYNCCVRVYQCSGSDVWEGETHIRTNDWLIEDEQQQFLQSWLEVSRFPLRTGLHIEQRPGMVNFSIVGRGATLGERKMYVKWDNENRERETIALQFNFLFGDSVRATVGGETGIDISPVGCDKSQILTDFSDTSNLLFFGDRMDFGGNDEPLARHIRKSYHVRDWKHTWELLKNL
jgi:phosphomannomutase